MIELIKFILSTVGLVMILNISKLFKPLREKISSWEYNTNGKSKISSLSSISDDEFPNWVKKAVDYHKTNKVKKNRLAWFFNSIFSCSLCMGVWAGLFIYLKNYIPYTEVIDYMCIGSCVSLILVTFYQFLEKK
jgi:hypothetical protein